MRQSIRARVEPPGGRRLDERLILRFPRLQVAVNRAFLRLPPRSRMRRLLLRRAVCMAVEASNRGDYEVAFSAFHADAALLPPEGVVSLGSFPSELRGRDERMRFEQRWQEDWGEAFRYEPEELIDLVDRILVLGRVIGTGPTSGAASESEWGNLLTLSDGQVITEQVFVDRAEALKAAGIGE